MTMPFGLEKSHNTYNTSVSNKMPVGSITTDPAMCIQSPAADLIDCFHRHCYHRFHQTENTYLEWSSALTPRSFVQKVKRHSPSSLHHFGAIFTPHFRVCFAFVDVTAQLRRGSDVGEANTKLWWSSKLQFTKAMGWFWRWEKSRINLKQAFACLSLLKKVRLRQCWICRQLSK